MTNLTVLVGLEARRPVRARLGSGWGGSPGRVWTLIGLLALAWAVSGLLATEEPLLNPAGAPLLADFWQAALHPDLSATMLRTTAEAALTTLSFAVLGTVASICIGLVFGVLTSQTWWRSTTRGRVSRTTAAGGLVASRAAVALPRGVHEVVWALLLVNVLGRDPLVGVLAIAIPFGAITAKVYAEMIDEADARPYEALRSSGAGRPSALLYGLLPATVPAMTSYAFYRFECSVRSAVILGMIGAGGIGLQLSLSFAGLQYEQMWTALYALVLLSALVDRWGASLRRTGTPRRWRLSLVTMGLLTVASLWHLAPDVSRWFSDRTGALLVGLFEDMFPLRLPVGGWAELIALSVETLQISLVAAVFAAGSAVAVASLAARTPTRGWRSVGSWLARMLLLLTRAIPPPVWALLVLFVVLPGPLPGALALGIYTFGILGRLFAEVVEDLDSRPRAALTRLGASSYASFAYATVPAASGQFVSYGLYRWEVTARETVVVGVVGAGGLGRLLEQQRAAFDYAAMTTTVLTLVVVSLLVDAISSVVRQSIR